MSSFSHKRYRCLLNAYLCDPNALVQDAPLPFPSAKIIFSGLVRGCCNDPSKSFDISVEGDCTLPDSIALAGSTLSPDYRDIPIANTAAQATHEQPTHRSDCSVAH